ncbi:protein-disulfide reductase DsbD family protein [Horticoccus sp. 23ND18S-11]|uniref:protein-disulfide reductase DsbD family protein n=1 Tax=Horticoccus sp. 23ND18S-11 TaxID=3391832 RepID=UPI0039C96D8E
MKLRLLSRALTFCLMMVSPRLHAAADAASAVQASLVAAEASVQPGRPITVALRLVHAPHWHTYWLNPGTGIATSVTWKLPPGWSAGEIQWPAPAVIRDRSGAVVGTGYEGDLLLPMTLTPPADAVPGQTVAIEASAAWLMCADACVPGSARLTLPLTVASDLPRTDPAVGEKLRAVLAGLPRADPAWNISASRKDGYIALAITPREAGGHAPRDLRFFSTDGLVGYDLPQSVKPDGRGGFVLSLMVAPDAPKQVTELTGVVTSENGWRSDGQLRGLAVNAALVIAVAGERASDPGASVPATAAAGLAGTLVLAFVGGLILNLMPCVFPVLGIKILGFVNQAGHQRSRVVIHGLAFTAGVLVSFWTLAGALAVLRAGGSQLGWGFQLQSAPFVFSLAVLLLVFALNMSGLFEFGLGAPAMVSNAPWMQKPKSNYVESLLTGVLATAVATPCSAPFLAPALGAALAVSTALSFLIFTTIAIGLSTPYLLLSIFPQAVKVLPRPGAWMETFKQFMAFPLYATVGYLIWVLAAQAGDEGLRAVLFGLVLVAMAVWMYGRWNAPGASTGRARFGLASLVVVGGFGVWLGWPGTEPAAGPGGTPDTTKVVWETWSPEVVERLRAEGRTVYVDFTARWCATCQTNKQLVFGSPAVRAFFAAHNIATLRADWTSRDARITAELARYQRSAVPCNVVWKPGADQPVVMPEILTPGLVLDAVRSTRDSGQ